MTSPDVKPQLMEQMVNLDLLWKQAHRGQVTLGLAQGVGQASARAYRKRAWCRAL